VQPRKKRRELLLTRQKYLARDESPARILKDLKKEPEARQLPSFVFRRKLRIESGHCDPDGVVFSRYVFEFFDINTWMLFEAALGVKRQNIAAAFDILGMPLVDARAEFFKPVRFGDCVEIASRVTEFRRSSFDVEHQIRIDENLAVNGGESRVWAVRSKENPEKISAAGIPSGVIARFE
jgi:4-hydroxybenzoyl-CoA thioesterase